MQVVSVLGRRPCGNGFGHPFGLRGMVQRCDASAGPSHRMGFAWAARWASRRMGRGARTVDHGVQPDPGCARTSRDQHHRKCRRNGLRRLGWSWELWRAGSRVRSRPTASRRRPADCWSESSAPSSAESLPRCWAWVRLPPSSVSAPGSSQALAPLRRWRSTASTSTDRARPLRLELGSRRIRRQPVGLPNRSYACGPRKFDRQVGCLACTRGRELLGPTRWSADRHLMPAPLIWPPACRCPIWRARRWS